MTPLEALRKCAWFIENVNEDTPDRVKLFFETREAWRNAMSNTQKIVVIVDGGLVQDIHHIPEGVEVEVRDFDIEGVQLEELMQTENGEKYINALYTYQGEKS